MYLKERKGCPLCEATMANKNEYASSKLDKNKYYEGESMSFFELLNKLIPDPKVNPKERIIKGVQIFFPETLFF